MEEVLESWSLIWFVKDLAPPLLALKVEEEAISQGMSVALGDGNSKETCFPLEPEERNTAVLTLLSVRNHSAPSGCPQVLGTWPSPMTTT